MSKVKKIKDGLCLVWNQHDTTIKELLKNNFSSGFLSRFKNGRFIIPESVIAANLKLALENEPDIVFDYLLCTKTGISIGVIYSKFFTHVKVEIIVHVEKAEINVNSQNITLDVDKTDLKGRNVSGIFAVIFVKTIISGLFNKSVFPKDISGIIKYDTGNEKINIELGDLDIIQEISKKKIFGTSKALLDIISVKDIQHTNEGLEIIIDYLPKNKS